MDGMGIAQPNEHTRKRDNIYTPEEVQQMMNYLGTKSISSIRNRAIISTLYRTQIRVSELCSLRLDDVVLDRAELWVPFGKGAKSRLVGVPRTGLIHLKSWMLWREHHKGIQESGSTWLFCVIRSDYVGNPLVREKVRDMVANVGKKAGIKKRVHPHGFRHSGTHHLLDCGVDFRTIRQQLGHAKLASTFRYCEGLNPKFVEEIQMRAQF
jgi:integrase/recombinase XerD